MMCIGHCLANLTTDVQNKKKKHDWGILSLMFRGSLSFHLFCCNSFSHCFSLSYPIVKLLQNWNLESFIIVRQSHCVHSVVNMWLKSRQCAGLYYSHNVSWIVAVCHVGPPAQMWHLCWRCRCKVCVHCLQCFPVLCTKSNVLLCPGS